MKKNETYNASTWRASTVQRRWGYAIVCVAATAVLLYRDSALLRAAPESHGDSSSIRLASPAFTGGQSPAIPTVSADSGRSAQQNQSTIQVRPRNSSWNGQIVIRPRTSGIVKQPAAAQRPTPPRNPHGFVSHPIPATPDDVEATEANHGFSLPGFISEQDLTEPHQQITQPQPQPGSQQQQQQNPYSQPQAFPQRTPRSLVPNADDVPRPSTRSLVPPPGYGVTPQSPVQQLPFERRPTQQNSVGAMSDYAGRMAPDLAPFSLDDVKAAPLPAGLQFPSTERFAQAANDSSEPFAAMEEIAPIERLPQPPAPMPTDVPPTGSAPSAATPRYTAADANGNARPPAASQTHRQNGEIPSSSEKPELAPAPPELAPAPPGVRVDSSSIPAPLPNRSTAGASPHPDPTVKYNNDPTMPPRPVHTQPTYSQPTYSQQAPGQSVYTQPMSSQPVLTLPPPVSAVPSVPMYSSPSPGMLGAPMTLPGPHGTIAPPVIEGMTIPSSPNSMHQGSPGQSHQQSAPIQNQQGVPQVMAPGTAGNPPLGGPAPLGHSIIFNQPHVAPPATTHHSFGGGSYPGTSGYRATLERDANPWLSPYQSRASQSQGINFSNPNLTSLPPGFQPWWDSVVKAPSGYSPSTMPVDLSMLLQDAMLYSPQVTAIKTEPEVQRLVIQQEAARFDWTAFLETTYDDLNDPVGNTLTTGNGQDRLKTRKVLGTAGFKQKNRHGGELRMAQDLGHENQNSRFFIPNNQATARLELSYRQPLWDGAGTVYNESEIVLAQIRANSSEDEVVEALQDHLVKVTEAYWALYSARAEYYQRRKLLSSAQKVLRKLEGRSQVDTIPRQVLRAKAAVARAQTRIQRTLARGKDAEAQLRLLVNSPGMLNGGPAELLPMEGPGAVTENASLQEVLQTALINRPDISEAIRKMRAAGVRLGVSENEILPRLDFLVETYVADLSGNSNIGRALRGQYTDNRPGYTVGLELEIPVGNRAALAKREQRRWELKRSMNVFRATVEKSLTDVEIANREVATSYSEMLSRFQSMSAAENESRYLQDRFEVLPASEDSATLLLEDLLDSFERLTDEETAFVQAQADHALSLVVLKKELGVLLKSRHSRPELEAGDQAWVNERISSTAMQQSGGAETVTATSSNIAQRSASPQRSSTPQQSASQTRTDQQNTQHSPSIVAPEPKFDPAQTVRPMPLAPLHWQRPSTAGAERMTR